MEIEDINAIREIRKDDIIIAFFGPTGVGKSYFIDLLTGQPGRRAGSALESVTQEIEATRVLHPKFGARVVLVDTPGFDNSAKPDEEILEMISDWLETTYNRDVRLSGLVYLHRITDNHMPGSCHKNLRMFGSLFGDHAKQRMVLVSTMWEKLDDQAVGERRETQLCTEFWKNFIEKGSGVDRLERNTEEEAWRIIEKLAKKAEARESVLLQEEMVDLQRKLNETEAGKTLYSPLQKDLADRKEILKMLLSQVEKSDDPKLKKELEREYKKIQDQFRKTFSEAKKLKIPLGRRIMVFFFGKRAHARTIRFAPNTKR